MIQAHSKIHSELLKASSSIRISYLKDLVLIK